MRVTSQQTMSTADIAESRKRIARMLMAAGSAASMLIAHPTITAAQYNYYQPYVSYGAVNSYSLCMDDDTPTDGIIRSCSAAIRSRAYSGGTLAQLYFARGKAHAEKNQCEKAIADFEAAIRHNPRLAEAREERDRLLRSGSGRATVAVRPAPEPALPRGNSLVVSPSNIPGQPTTSVTVLPATTSQPTGTASVPGQAPAGPPSITGSVRAATDRSVAAPPAAAPAPATTLSAQPGGPTPSASNSSPSTVARGPAIVAPSPASTETKESSAKKPADPAQQLKTKLANCAPGEAAQGKSFRPIYARLQCTVGVLAAEAASIESDYASVVNSNYSNPKDTKATCAIAPEKIEDDLTKSAMFDKRVETLQREFEANVSATEELKNIVREVNLGPMENPQKIMKDMLATAMAPIEKASIEHLKVRQLVQKIQKSQNAMDTVRKIREIFCDGPQQRS